MVTLIPDEQTAFRRQEAAGNGNTPIILALERWKEEGDELEATMY